MKSLGSLLLLHRNSVIFQSFATAPLCFYLFTPNTPTITAAQRTSCSADKFSLRMNIPASTDTTVMRFEYDALLTGGRTEVE